MRNPDVGNSRGCEPSNDIISVIALTGHPDDSLARRADVPANGGQCAWVEDGQHSNNLGTHAIECAAGVPEPRARQRTGELHSAVFWAGSEIEPVSPHQNNDAITRQRNGVARVHKKVSRPRPGTVRDSYSSPCLQLRSGVILTSSLPLPES